MTADSLGRSGWRDIARALFALVLALPHVTAAGWRADALRRALFVPALMGAGIGLYFWLPVEPSLVALAMTPLFFGAWLASRASLAVAPTIAALLAASIGFSLAIVRTQM